MVSRNVSQLFSSNSQLNLMFGSTELMYVIGKVADVLCLNDYEHIVLNIAVPNSRG